MLILLHLKHGNFSFTVITLNRVQLSLETSSEGWEDVASKNKIQYVLDQQL